MNIKKMLARFKKRILPKNKKIPRNLLLFCVGGLFFVGAIMVIWLATLTLPDLKSFESRQVPLSTKIYDRTGEILLYDLHADVKRTAIPFSDMGSYVKNATVAIEDSKFYGHRGIRIAAILRAVLANLNSGSFSQGGSTITQQIVKNSLLTKDKTITRKLKEWVLALKMERILTKEEILSIYLNESPYGGNIYGIEEASQTFFGKHAKDLTLPEAAYLAAIPQAPTYYSPYGKNKEKLDERKNIVLNRMRELGFITEDELTQAKNELVTFKLREATGIKAPHFVFFINEYLAEKYGEDVIARGGLKVITTLDYTLQEKAEELVLKYALSNEEKYKAENAALVSIDPKTGHILTMVGSRDYFDKEIDGAYNVTTARRQPGSAFKPIVYAAGFMKGYTPETVLFDVPTEFNTSCSPYGGAKGSGCYMPRNFTGQHFGPITLKSALAQSINIVAVKMLYLVGIDEAIKVAEDMGIKSLETSKEYGLSLVLGGGEVRPLDMASAYGVFGNNGIRHEATGVLRIETSEGEMLEEYKETEGAQVIPKQVALQISSILSDNGLRTPMFGANSNMYIPGRTVAVKTGTTNDFKDGWIVGYTPSFVTAVWVGNNDNTEMAEKSSVTLSGPLWNEYMRSALPKFANEGFEQPEPIPNYENLKPILRGVWLGGETFTIDTVSGKLATELTPPEAREDRVITNVHDILYWINHKDPLGPGPSNPYNDPQFKNWETAVQNWWSTHAGNYPVGGGIKPIEYDDVHTSTTKPTVVLTGPTSGGTYVITSPITVTATMSGAYPPARMDVFVNGKYIGTTTGYPFAYSFTPSELGEIAPGDPVEIRVIVFDSAHNQNEATMNITMGN